MSSTDLALKICRYNNPYTKFLIISHCVFKEEKKTTGENISVCIKYIQCCPSI